MKFSSLEENLKHGLFIVGHVAGKNQNLPILNNVMIEAKEGNIKFTSTNLEIGISSVIRGKVDRDGSYTVDSKILSDYISLLPNKKVEIEHKDDKIIVDCENFKTKIKGQSAEDYPLIPGIDRTGVCRVDASAFKKAVSQVVFAASTNETRIELSGVLFSFNENELTLAATDSYRLTEKKIQITNELSEEQRNKKFIIPAKTVQEIYRVLSGSKENLADESNILEIYLSENQVLFVYGTTELISRLIEGQYPDYRQIIPTVSKTVAIVETNQLVKAVKASSLFSKTGINDINLDFPKETRQMMISSASGMAGENITGVDAEIIGEDNGAVVNYRYLLDGLSNIDGDVIKIEIVDNNTPCIIRAEKDDSYLYIIMPIKQ
ncbi:MAG: polymerase III subunit beta protein [Parcubacteria group bacterium GW2011_GWE2_38_18]|nr:MAG: polymerase III subunit beta protein [Parcubacteria group bacterium GW2011_GWE2_38_18]